MSGLTRNAASSSSPPSDADTHLVLASDGLFAEEARGGGGGLDNATVAELCAAAAGTSCGALAETLVGAAAVLPCAAAVPAGSYCLCAALPALGGQGMLNEVRRVSLGEKRAAAPSRATSPAHRTALHISRLRRRPLRRSWAAPMT